MAIQIATPGQLAQMLRGQDVHGLRSLQVKGQATLDGGLSVAGPALIAGVPVDKYLPRGVVPGGLVYYTSSQGGIGGAMTTITGFTMKVTIVPGRLYWIRVELYVTDTVGTDIGRMDIQMDGTTIKQTEPGVQYGGGSPGMNWITEGIFGHPSSPIQIAPGVHSFTTRVGVAAGTGTITVLGNTGGNGAPCTFTCMDIGSSDV